MEDSEHPDRMHMDKLLFLSKRALRSSSDSEGAFEFGKMAVRKKELCVNDENMILILDSIITQALGKPLEKASALVSVNNEAAICNKLLEALSIKAKISSLL